MKIISISGLDGSGKSTQIKLLRQYLEAQGKSVFYFHAIDFSISTAINKKIKSSFSRSAQNLPSGEKTPSVTKANWIKLQLRKIALIADLKRFRKLHAKLEKSGCDYILSDRYFFDTVINITYLAKKTEFKVRNFFKWRFEKLQPDLAIYLNLSPAVIMQRAEKPDQGLDYLQKKKELYEQAVKIWDFEVIDGNQSPDNLFEEIKKLCQAKHIL